MTEPETTKKESPEYVRMSLAAAMTLNFVPGMFYRGARLKCINLLMNYEDGCKANCAFCGLASQRRPAKTGKSFIRVPWKTYSMGEVMEALNKVPSYVSRVCISMITHPKSKRDVIPMCEQIAQNTSLAVSLLISPTLLDCADLIAMKQAGAERIGVAIDAATEDLFTNLRGKPVKGPHNWSKYWEIYQQSLEIFGKGMAGVHLICGIGETEKEIVSSISRARKMGGSTHLFCFFPEQGSSMESVSAPPVAVYRRVQLARWLIDNDKIDPESISYDNKSRITDFGISKNQLDEVISDGGAFQTSGCPGADGKVACNRPYGNEKPGPNIRNFPFAPELEDLDRIRREIFQY